MRYLNKEYKNLEELKKDYRRLVKKYHPDINENGLEIMKIVNNEYEELFDILNTTKEKATDFMDIINNIINLELEIEIVGTWIWVYGDTYDHKETLKENGLKWAKKKKKWYYNPDKSYKKFGKREYSYNEIKGMYKSKKVKNKKEKILIN